MTDDPSAPMPSASSTLAAAAGWYFETRCRCRLVFHPVTLLLKDMPASRRIGDVAGRLRCRRCGERPGSVALVDEPQASAPGFIGGRSVRRVEIAAR